MNRTVLSHWFVLLLFLFGGLGNHFFFVQAQDFIPRKQTSPPGPPLAPDQAIQRMRVPEGFRVELVASEPAIKNPVAMAFDDAGRIFVTESYEYPRREPGPGRDRILILEDKNGDGVAESTKIFAEGLNIPSGIAVGYGGVWVANAPDILFLEDTNGDDVADKSTVVVTGFGRDDTHELPNALTWGPDGYLYGLNGVFNRSIVKQDGKTFDFTCAMFRIDPRTKKFSLFCEGTSNPWGIAFDSEGSAFVSACVIDHLWHLTESAYYLRQGGPYPPNTFYAESIVKHKHQMAAYCGIEFFDSDAYPAKYNNLLYMGNIHGGCLNCDRVERAGATYKGSPEPDFLTANDVWFMPVAQKIGPDGCLYVLDWYDRYHCYQDANADPKGVDRGHGRLYRIVHGQRPKARYRDISKLNNTELINALNDPNLFVRQRAQLQLQLRGTASMSPIDKAKLQAMVNDSKSPMKIRLHAMWSIVGSGLVDESWIRSLLKSESPELRAWAVRTAGQQQFTDASWRSAFESLASDSDPRVRIEVAIATPKLALGQDAAAWNISQQTKILAHSQSDPILSRVVWQNMLPHMEEQQLVIVEALLAQRKNEELLGLATRFSSFLVSRCKPDLSDEGSQRNLQSVLRLAGGLAKNYPGLAASIFENVLAKARNRELQLPMLESRLNEWFAANLSNDSFSIPKGPIGEWNGWHLALLQSRLLLKDKEAVALATVLTVDPSVRNETRRQLLLASRDNPVLLQGALKWATEILATKKEIDASLRDTILDLGIASASLPEIAWVLERTPAMKSTFQAAIAERMCQRAESTKPVLEQISNKTLRKELVSPNRVRLLASSNDPEIRQLVTKIWGTVSAESSKEREQVINKVAETLRWDARGDAQRGWVVYDRICGQCHKLHDRGYEVGPNITSNGRGSYEQLLVSVFNPSLVIGEAFKSVTIRTADDQIVTGLLVERNETRTVVKIQGGKEQVLLADDIEEFKQDAKSLMPEGIEKQMSNQELADLFALLTLESSPDSKENATIAGTPENLHSQKKP